MQYQSDEDQVLILNLYSLIPRAWFFIPIHEKKLSAETTDYVISYYEALSLVHALDEFTNNSQNYVLTHNADHIFDYARCSYSEKANHHKLFYVKRIFEYYIHHISR